MNSEPPAAGDNENGINLADYITTEEAAELSGYHVNYIRRLMRQGKITGRKAGLMWWIERNSLRDYLRAIQELGAGKFRPHSSKQSQDE